MAYAAVASNHFIDSIPIVIPLRPPPVDWQDESSPGSRIAKLITDLPFMLRMRKRGEYLFHAGDAFHFLYVVNAGFAKTCYTTEDGREQTVGLHLRGDILGLDAIAAGSYGCDAVALDACDVLSLPYDAIIACCKRSPELMRELFQAFSGELRSDRDSMLSMRTTHAAGRVAAFLLEMSDRLAARGFSATQLQLRLTRQEIGSMLGLKLETVSRALSRFADLRLITVCLRQIVLLDRDGLLDIIAQPAGLKLGREKYEREESEESEHFFCRATGLSPVVPAA